MAKHLIDGETFATDKALHEKCSAILHRGSGRDGDVADRLIDAAIGEAWIVFHRAHAVLQITSARANMVQGTRAP